MRKTWVFCLIIVFLVIGTVYTITKYKSTHKNLGKRAVPTVSVITVQKTSFQPTIDAVGNFVANQGVTLKAEADGRVTKVNFTSGQEVKKGDVLIEFNNLREQGALNYAKAQHSLSVMTYQRNANLEGTGAVSQEALDEAKADMDSNEGNMQEAEGDYNLTIIKAPFDGRLGLKTISVGDYLESADDIVTLQNLNPMFLDFSISEKYLSQISVGEKVDVQPNTLPDKTITGTVKSYETVINTDTGMITVRATVPNDKNEILPGAYAEVTLYAGKAADVLTVPQAAIVYDAAGNYVYKIEDNKAVKQIVELGDQVDQAIEITKGLSVGDVVVSAGTNKIHEGSAVKQDK